MPTSRETNFPITRSTDQPGDMHGHRDSGTVPVGTTFSVYKPAFIKRRPHSQHKTIKHGVKWLADGQDPKVLKSYIRKAPDGVIKAIANAALNAKQGKINLTKAEKKLFAKHRGEFSRLVDQKRTVKSKRRLLQSGRGIAAIIAPILGAVISAIGSRFIPGNNSS